MNESLAFSLGKINEIIFPCFSHGYPDFPATIKRDSLIEWLSRSNAVDVMLIWNREGLTLSVDDRENGWKV